MLRAIRPAVFWLHLLAGVTAGVIVLLMSATGVALTYERQIVAWADARALAAPPATPSAEPLPLDSVVARARAARGTAPTAVTVRADRTAPATVAFGREATLYVDRATGTVLGEGAPGVRRAFRAITDWHRWLGREGDGRKTARAITGAANLAFLVLALSGLVLWLPRSWTWARVRAVAWFRPGLSGKARDFNWHHVAGLWSALPLVVVIASGVVMSYPWANRLVFRAFGEQPPAQGGGPGGARPAASGAAATPAPSGVGLDALVALGAAKVPEWRSVQVELPQGAARNVNVTVDAGTGGQPQRRGRLVVDRRSGSAVRWEPFSSQTPGRRARSFLRFAHTGEVWGVVGQTIAGLASLGGVVLVWTGLALALRRLVRWLARRGRDEADDGRREATRAA